MFYESKLDVTKKWYFGNNRSKNLTLHMPAWNTPLFLTSNFNYAKEYADYGVYILTLDKTVNLNICDFNKKTDVSKLHWPKIVVDAIKNGRNDLNSIAYDMYILAYQTNNRLMYIQNTVEWRNAALYFKNKSNDIFNYANADSVWGSEQDHKFLLQMWKDIYDAKFNGFMHTEFGNLVLAVFNVDCLDKISAKPIK